MKAIQSATLILAAVALLATPRAQAGTSDAAIAASAKSSFVFRHFLKRDAVHVKSSDGVVTLTGTVSESFHKTLAEEAVKAQSGVKSVDNQIVVKAGGPAEGSDAWLTAKVKATLLFHRSVSARETKVESKGGVVTLRGAADSQAQKDLTAEYVKDVDGVNDVKNEMTVAGGASMTHRLEEKIDDASITAEVKAELLFHRSTSAMSTTVTTMNGVVTLGGTAKNTAEKDLASKIVKDVRGVKDVDNQMTVSAQ